MTRILLLLLLLAFLFTGCSSQEKSTVPVRPATSSNEALLRALKAMEERDTEALLSTISGGAKAQAFFASIMDTYVAVDTFRTKFVESYGEDAWNTFQAPLAEDEHRPDMTLLIVDFSELYTKASGWEASGENDAVFHGLQGISLPFKELAEGWVIDGAEVFPDKETLVGYTETQEMLTEFISSYLIAIGHEGIRAEDLDYQMGKDLMQVLMGGGFTLDGASPNPDRFNIDEL